MNDHDVDCEIYIEHNFPYTKSPSLVHIIRIIFKENKKVGGYHHIASAFSIVAFLQNHEQNPNLIAATFATIVVRMFVVLPGKCRPRNTFVLRDAVSDVTEIGMGGVVLLLFCGHVNFSFSCRRVS